MDNKKATLELGTKPVGKLLVQYALPAIIAMTASSLYNMIDSIFIGQGCGPLAISGLAITFPFQNLAAAFGAGVGVGAATCISVKLGQKDYATAQRIFGINITLNLLVGIVFSIITLSFLNPILLFFGASKDTLPYAREYMEVILAGNVIQQMFFGLNAVLRAASKPKHAMGASMLSVLLNVILAPIFIWPLGMGIRGAAWATVISQSVALAWQCRLFSNKNEIMHFRRGIYRPESQIVKNIFAIGMSPFAMNVCACIVVIFINTGLQKYGGDMAVGAYGIANKMAFIFIMINMGVNQGMFPITGYNYGARRYDRLLRLLKYGLCTPLHHRCHTHQHIHQSHTDKHARLPARRHPDDNNGLLPRYRKGEDKHAALALQTDAIPAASAHRPATLRRTGRHLDFAAYSRHHSVYTRHYNPDTVCAQVPHDGKREGIAPQ